MSNAGVRYLSFSALILFIGGVLLPCMSVIPRAGQYHEFIKFFSPDSLKVETHSILSGIYQMFTGESIVLGFILLIFSIIFPLFKLIIFIYSTYQQDVSNSKSLKWAIALGKFSMLDVFVIALLALTIKTLPGGTVIIIEPGTYFFAISVFLSVFIGLKIKQRLPEI